MRGAAALALLAAAAAAAEERFELAAPRMGTEARIVLYAAERTRAEAAAQAALARIGELEAALSDYQEESELSLFVRRAGGPALGLGPDLFAVLSRAQDLARRSDGAFDVTCGPLSRLWRRARRRGEPPDPAELQEALRLVGHERLVLDARSRTGRLLQPGMRLDLGGIAKGYAAEEALRVLHERGLSRSLVSVGGEVVAGLPPPGRPGWTVAIRTPGTAPPPLLLTNAAVSTSGDAEQHLEAGGVRYSHVFDPRTGRALEGRRSVTVVAPEGATADALATAVGVLGAEKGLALVETIPGASVLVVEEDGQGVRTMSSRTWGTLPRVAAEARCF